MLFSLNFKLYVQLFFDLNSNRKIYQVYQSDSSFSDAYPGDQYIKNVMDQFKEIASETGNSSWNQKWINSGGPAYYAEIYKFDSTHYVGNIYSYDYRNGFYQLYLNGNYYTVIKEYVLLN